MDNKQVEGAIKVYMFIIFVLWKQASLSVCRFLMLDWHETYKLKNSKTYKLKNYFCL